MNHPRLQPMLAAFDQRWPGARRRTAGITLALAIEAGLFLAILTLGGAPEAKYDQPQRPVRDRGGR